MRMKCQREALNEERIFKMALVVKACQVSTDRRHAEKDSLEILDAPSLISFPLFHFALSPKRSLLSISLILTRFHRLF